MNEPSWMRGPPASILLATDLSARSDRALDRAASLAKQWRSHLTILHVIENVELPSDAANSLPSWRRPPDPLTLVKQNIADDLSEVAEAASILVEDGSVVETIMRVARSENSDLIVIGVARNELLGALMLGRTVDRLLRRSQVPLLIVKNRVRRPYRHVVVATDFSDSSRHALVAATRFFPEQALTLFHAYDPPMPVLMNDPASYRREYRTFAEQECDAFLKETEKSQSGWQRPHVLIEHGAPSHVLHEYVVDHSADLVVVGTQGRSAIADVFIGSIAKRILNDVPCDILVVREPHAKVES